MQSETQHTNSLLAVTLLASSGSIMAAISSQYSQGMVGNYLLGFGLFLIATSALLLIRVAFKRRQQR